MYILLPTICIGLRPFIASKHCWVTKKNTSMAYLLGVLCNFVMLIIFLATTNNTCVEAAREFNVGGHFGWRVPDPNDAAFYTQWAERNRFQVGDSLVFEYENDSVLTVEKWDYFRCDASNPITAFDNGKSTLNLDRPGAFYFISGTDDHCNNGQKLLVEVMSPHPIPDPKSQPPISVPPISLPPEGFSPSPMAPSPQGFSPTAYSPSESIEDSASVVLSLGFMAPLATFVVVLLIAL